METSDKHHDPAASTPTKKAEKEAALNDVAKRKNIYQPVKMNTLSSSKMSGYIKILLHRATHQKTRFQKIPTNP
jgi:hypothetical protein